jgi:pheromone shutdown-related protein TraB
VTDERSDPSEVRRVALAGAAPGEPGREVVLVGTAHVSRESVALVREVIERERPDAVCIELDAQRHEALAERVRFEDLDLREVIRRGALSPLLANLLLAAWQRRLGGALGVAPGSELLEASRTAERLGIPVALCDRDVRVTLRRAWASMGWWSRSRLVAELATGLFERPELSEDELRRLRERDVLSELLDALGAAYPGLKRVLIDERDAWLADRVRATAGRRLVAVAGAGHLDGMERALHAAAPVDLAALSEIPPVSPAWRWLGWSVPALAVAALLAIGLRAGPAAAGENLSLYVLATGLPASLGAAAAFAHPLTIAAAFAVAPVTVLSPLVGAGHVLALIEAWLRPPRVAELERVASDAGRPRAWWRNRLLRALLVFVFTSVGAAAGGWLGLYRLFRAAV